MKKPFLYALVAAIYIVNIVLVISFITSLVSNGTILIPIAMLSLLVLSVAVMGFLFLYEPFQLYMENRKREAVIFFVKIIGFFACFVFLSVVLLFIF
jgi:hypothetical protein